MKIKSIEIIDYKSVKKETLSVLHNQLCLVGKNESGKSSILSAISYLNILDTKLEINLLNKSSKNYPNGLPIIIGVFELSKKSYSKFYKILAKFLNDEILVIIDQEANTSLIQIKRWGNGLLNMSVTLVNNGEHAYRISDHIKNLSAFYDSFFNDIYPNIEYYEREDLLIEPSTVDDLLGSDKKFETFRKLLTIGGCTDFNTLKSQDINFISTYLSDIEIQLNRIFIKHYKQDDSISIKISPTFGDKLNLIIRDNSERSFSINERSPGFQYYFAFIVNKLYNNFKAGEKNTILLLDEPGGSLHPKGTKDLLKTFDEIAQKSQIIFTTHNPFLAIRNSLDSLIFVNKSAKEGTKINKKPFLNKYQVLRKELGILLNDSFLIGDINLVVEGNTEKLAFHHLFQFEKYRDLEWMNIYNADGVTNIPQAMNYLGPNNLSLSGIVIMDSDKEADDVKKVKAYINTMKESNWQELSINSVFTDTKIRTFEDLFPQDLLITAFNNYCTSLKSLEVFDKDYENLPNDIEYELPIVNTFNVHYKKFLPDDSRSSITKQDVIRYFFDIIESQPETEQLKNLETAFKLCDKIKSQFLKIETHVNNQA